MHLKFTVRVRARDISPMLLVVSLSLPQQHSPQSFYEKCLTLIECPVMIHLCSNSAANGRTT
jgi:hypothetical protein